jgi:replicative DNA helicase
MTAVEETLEDDKGRKVGIPNRELLSGKLNEDYETYFLTMIKSINEYYPGELVLQAKGEKGRGKLRRSLDDLDRELEQEPSIDVVVVDPIYGFSDVYGKNSNKTSGGAAEQATRRFENIIGDHNVIGIYAVQADVDKKAFGEEGGAHEIRLPRRDKVKTTKALLEIATILFSFDSNNDGLARIGIEKGRDGGEDFELELLSLLDYGVLREMPSGEIAAGQFTMPADFNP